MARRQILSLSERESLLALPDDELTLTRMAYFSEHDLALTVYMERAVDALKRKGVKINDQLLSHLSPLGWEHINLTGDYIWKSNRIPASGKFRRLRPAKVERSKNSLNVQ